jgi:hypothetical protein
MAHGSYNADDIGAGLLMRVSGAAMRRGSARRCDNRRDGGRYTVRRRRDQCTTPHSNGMM